MARIKGAMHTRKRHKKVLKLAKGYRGGRSRLFRTANEAVMKAMESLLDIPFRFENEGTAIIHDEWESFEKE